MRDPHPKRVTLYDVARRSGVSYQTVSRVINSHPHVSKSTRQRVLQAIAELDYRPNHAAQSLVTRRSYTIGVITYGSGYYGPAQMVANVASIANERGYHPLVSNISDATPDHMRDRIREAIDTLSGRLVDGIIVIMPCVGIGSADLCALCGDIPSVQIATPLGTNVASVVIDQHTGARLATQHLIDLGHCHIGEIRGPLGWFDAEMRHEGWQATLAAALITPGPVAEGDWTAAGGYAAACKLLDAGVEFSALFVGNDQMALGVMRALRERGLHVPRDVSIVGFDDVPEAAFYEPPLTTIQQDFSALGRQSVEYLVELIDHPDASPAHQRVLYPRFIKRHSTAQPASSAPR